MSDHANDIDALRFYLNETGTSETHRYRRALIALVAERDGYLEGNKQTLRALAEANEIAKRYKRERDEARRIVCIRIALDETRSYMGTDGYPYSKGPSAMEIAAERGWDCFAQQEGGGA